MQIWYKIKTKSLSCPYWSSARFLHVTGLCGEEAPFLRAESALLKHDVRCICLPGSVLYLHYHIMWQKIILTRFILNYFITFGQKCSGCMPLFIRSEKEVIKGTEIVLRHLIATNLMIKISQVFIKYPLVIRIIPRCVIRYP